MEIQLILSVSHWIFLFYDQNNVAFPRQEKSFESYLIFIKEALKFFFIRQKKIKKIFRFFNIAINDFANSWQFEYSYDKYNLKFWVLNY